MLAVAGFLLKIDGEGEQHAGWAIVQAAIDWRRTGMARPIPEPLLRTLYVGYRREHRADASPGDEDFAEGLEWARKPIVSRVALLDLVEDPPVRSFRAFDYIVEYPDGQRGNYPRPIRPETWDFILARAAAGEALKVGFTAYVRGERDVAEQAWQQVRGHPLCPGGRRRGLRPRAAARRGVG